MWRLLTGAEVCALSRFNRVRLCATHRLEPRPSQAPLSMGFSRQEYWSGLPCPPPGDPPNPGIEPASLNVSCVGRLVTTSPTWEALGAETGVISSPGGMDRECPFQADRDGSIIIIIIIKIK